MYTKISEIFSSIQGEGLHMGCPSVFVRLFGCNFTCSGFSNNGVQTKTYEAPTAKSIQELDGNSFQVGCDSRYAWHPDFKHLQTRMTTEQLSEAILAKSWGINHLVLTGGEPMLHQEMIADLLYWMPFDHVTFETNASIPLRPAVAELFAQWLSANSYRTMLFSNSPKLAHSGEPIEKRLNVEAVASQRRLQYATQVEGHDGAVIQTFKYVVGSREHFEEAKKAHTFLMEMPDTEAWEHVMGQNMPMAMPLGATLDQYNAVKTEIADLSMEYGFRFTPRLHLELYGNAIGT